MFRIFLALLLCQAALQSAGCILPPSAPPPIAVAEMAQHLPEGIDLDTLFVEKGSGPDHKTISVKQKLIDLQARIQKGKIVDANGREVLFYPIPVIDAQSPSGVILARRHAELTRRLEKGYHVVYMAEVQSPS